MLVMKISQLFPSKYVKAADLNGKSVTLTIAKLVLEELGHGPEKERKPVLYFQKATKGLVLNRTNAMIVVGLYGDESDEWEGKRITIYPTKVRAFGAMQETIRVKEFKPPPLTQDGHAENEHGIKESTVNVYLVNRHDNQIQVEEASEIDDAEDVLDAESVLDIDR
jgi:hypothetical protein